MQPTNLQNNLANNKSALFMQDLSCLIPLYKSWKFRHIITQNIDAHLAIGTSIIVSDRHGLDQTIDYLLRQYRDDPRVLILSYSDRADWVENINGMLKYVETDFFRIIPHDDTASAESSKLLLDVLKKSTDSVLATGVVHAKNRLGIRLKKRDELNLQETVETKHKWSLNDALTLYWQSRFAGAFKGVIRAKIIQDKKIFIKKTPTLTHSERTWLFALALEGSFCFVPKSILIKRYYRSSTHQQWRYTQQTTLDAANVMADYCDQLITDSNLAYATKLSIFYNALKQIESSNGLYQYTNLMDQLVKPN